jgi:hypothetical protein
VFAILEPDTHRRIDDYLREADATRQLLMVAAERRLGGALPFRAVRAVRVW